MADFDVISLSSESSRPSSPFINMSEVFNDSENINKRASISCNETNFAESSKDSSPFKNRIIHDLSESDSSESELVVPNNDILKSSDISCSEVNRLLNRYGKDIEQNPRLEQQNLHDVSKSKRSTQEPIENLLPPTKKRNGEMRSLITKEQKLEEKRLRQREKEQKRSEKLAAKELQNYIKPGNCIKYMTVMVDSSLVACPYGGKLLASIQNSESKCHMSSHVVPHTIFWKRELPGIREEEENFLLVVWDWQTLIPALKNHSICSQIQDIQAQHYGKSIYLVFYGLSGYFSYIKSKRRKNSGDIQKKKKKGKDDNEFPYITRKEIEEELIELQIMTNCNHRIVETPDDLSQLIIQITKAIAETPFKLEKQRRELENLEWFAVGDSRDCVTVDKAGNGLLRLWQQQLCQFNLAGHDVAQAIASAYPSPRSLVTSYDKCSSQKEREDLLKDIHIRRCQGPLTTSRRIGPELSKKICTFFCSEVGDAPLSQEQ